MKKALVTGITGQDGSYLAELLLEKGYEVHGIVRRASSTNTCRISRLVEGGLVRLHDGDLSDSQGLCRIVADVRPCEIYNLAAQSHVGSSFRTAEYTCDIDALGALRVLEAVRLDGLAGSCRIYQASTSELYGKVEQCPQDEGTPFHPFSPYAVAKQFAYWIMREYREAYGMFISNGILFNHESERRGEEFVTRKITIAAGRIACGLQDHLELGNLGSLRDWGYARDYVECMWLMLQHEEPGDFVVATGEQHTVREFAELAFAKCGIELEWRGAWVNEKGYDKRTGRMLVCISEEWFRPTDVVNLLGNPAKAKSELGWSPATSFRKLVEIMAEHDLDKAKREAHV
jgi:GDPmannose 4,6-dehydratase